MKAILKIFAILIIIIVIFGAVAYSKYNSTLNSPIGTDSTKKVFMIQEGMFGNAIIDKLQTEGILTSLQNNVLKIYLKLNPLEFQKGTYKIPLNISPKEILTVLQNPELTDIWITIPEGLRKDEIADVIAREYEGLEGAVFSKDEFLAFCKDNEFIESLELGIKTSDLEGFLYPDKYLMPAQATTEYVITALINTFKEKAGEITYKQLIIASMLEREGLSDTDRPMISDIIKKRLNEGWLLQIDATLLYYYKDWKHVITEEDKKKNQPYNTYAKIGLPPTPICNPGVSSMNAAKSPKSNAYYYYIHDDNGVAHYARTLSEHQLNISKYLN